MRLGLRGGALRGEAFAAAAGAEGEDDVGEGAEEGAEEQRHGHHGHQRDEVEPVRQLLPHGARHEPLLRQDLSMRDIFHYTGIG